MGKSKGGRKKPPQAPNPKPRKEGSNLNKNPFRWSFEKLAQKVGQIVEREYMKKFREASKND